MTYIEFTLKALTDIWTGDVNRQGNRLIATGLLGSIRWWFEVLVRGLGGRACDPTLSEIRCPAPSKTPSEPGHHCVVCELFGCTGWARKFRFEVLDENRRSKSDQIKAGDIFILRFTELRPIREEEWCLLNLTLRLIAEYGAIGGKTVFKPTDEQNRQNAFHHKDFGLISIVEAPSAIHCVGKEASEAYVRDGKWRADFNDRDFSWASLTNFWCVKGRYLARQDADESTFNKVIGRQEPKNSAQHLRNDATTFDAWLAGRQQESKKVFSFKEPPRTFGFVNPDLQDSNQRSLDFNEIRRRLEQVWPNFQDSEFLDGQTILQSLLSSAREGRHDV
jgi:CRISPR-associated protein Cmr1